MIVVPVAMEQAARTGGKILRDWFCSTSLTAVCKNETTGEQCTQADTQAEKIIISLLRETFPSATIVAEESGAHEGSGEDFFFLDPTDGTQNIISGIAHFSVSLARYKKAGDSAVLMPHSAIVYNPVSEQCYQTNGMGGTYCNSRLCYVNGNDAIRKATICLCDSYTGERARHAEMRRILAVDVGVWRVEEWWSIALDLCRLADGLIDGVISLGCGGPYDIAAGKFIAQQAGAKITNLQGNPEASLLEGAFIASNGHIHDQLVEAVRRLG